MFLKTVFADGQKELAVYEEMKKRAEEAGNDIDASVKIILEDIQKEGLSAVQRYSLQFDKKEGYELSKEDINSLAALCPPDLYKALCRAAENIREYHSHMVQKSWRYDRGDGQILGQEVRGLTCVGIYVPGGTAAYPSSVLMNAIPARVAGVEEIIMVTPPTENLNPQVIAAAKIAGVDRIIALGGAVAVAALTYGAGFIPKVDKIVGPGNAYVASAKKQVFGKVDIDMIAGPSEVLVIADKNASAAYVAADLLSQAEHDVLASCVLVTDDGDLAAAVSLEMEKQTALLKRQGIIKESVKNFGFAVVTKNLEEACAFANLVAPEHLEVMTENPEILLPLLKNAGAIFLGEYTPEPLGDYMAGPCHVLPTSGTARFFSPLSVDTFLKKTSVISYSKSALQALSQDIIALAESEKLDAHANAVAIRFK